MHQVTITEGSLRLRNGQLTIKTRTAPPEQKEKAQDADVKAEEPPAAKTTAERQKELYKRRKEAGWKKVWVDPETLALAERLNGIENIPNAYSQLLSRVQKEKETPVASIQDYLVRSWERVRSFFR